MSRIGLAIAAILALSLGCAPADTDRSRDRPVTSSRTPAPEPNTLPALFDDDISGGDLRRTGTATDLGAYTTQTVTYRSGDRRVSGVLSVPDGKGPFPAVTLNHGYIDPAVYQSGQGMPRERDYLARAGFVVLHVDYRGHADSAEVQPMEHVLRLGYVRDAIAAVKALRQLPEVDPERVAMAGRSMGGGVTFGALVAKPGIVDAAVVWSSVSTRFVDNYRRWIETGRPDQARQFEQRWGTVESNPAFWSALSPRSYFDRVNASVMMHHGTNDEQCPYPWALATRDALRRADRNVTFYSYEGERHTFSRDWELSMQRTVRFLRANA